MSERKKCSRNDEALSKGHISQLKRAMVKQIQENLSIKIHNDSNTLYTID